MTPRLELVHVHLVSLIAHGGLVLPPVLRPSGRWHIWLGRARAAVSDPGKCELLVHVATIERAKQIEEAEARATKRYFDPNGAEGKAWLAEFSKPACPLLTHN